MGSHKWSYTSHNMGYRVIVIVPLIITHEPPSTVGGLPRKEGSCKDTGELLKHRPSKHLYVSMYMQ